MTHLYGIGPDGKPRAVRTNDAGDVLVSGGTGGGSGGGDASAANQLLGNASLASIDADIGAPADAAASTDTGTFSLIALFKRLLAKFTVGFSTPSASLSTVPARGNLTNISGTITAGGTAQQIAAANSQRLGWKVRNLSTSSLWVSTLATAVQSQPSLEIRAGEMYETPPGAQGTGAISIIGPSTGQAFFAREW